VYLGFVSGLAVVGRKGRNLRKVRSYFAYLCMFLYYRMTTLQVQLALSAIGLQR
jgi:hypothetical protein